MACVFDEFLLGLLEPFGFALTRLGKWLVSFVRLLDRRRLGEWLPTDLGGFGGGPVGLLLRWVETWHRDHYYPSPEAGN
jgi:hypothetical protein